jgi:hypothetical protein
MLKLVHAVYCCEAPCEVTKIEFPCKITRRVQFVSHHLGAVEFI